MNGLLLDNHMLIGVILSLLASWLYSNRCTPNGRASRLLVAAAWFVGISILFLNSFVRPVYDDEVYYLAQSAAGLRGEVRGCLPMRLWIYFPLLWLNLSPGTLIVLARIVTVGAALCSAIIFIKTADYFDLPTGNRQVMGALLLLALGYLPMGTLVPEYPAFIFLMIGIFCLIKGLGHDGISHGFLLSGFFAGLAGLISLRTTPLGLAICAAAYLCQAKPRSFRPLVHTMAGGVLALIPTLAYIITYDSFSSIIYWNYTFFRNIGTIRFDTPAHLPEILAFAAMAGLFVNCEVRDSSPRRKALTLLWCAATVSAILNPQKMEHTLALWIALSILMAAIAFHEIALRLGRTRGRKVSIFLTCLLFWSLFIPNFPANFDPSELAMASRQMHSGLELLDWLDRTAKGDYVACVPPFHPIAARNAWSLWNVIYYCYIFDAATNREISPGLVNMLESGKAAIIEWDPWPEESNCGNILKYLVTRDFLSREQAGTLAKQLRDRYELVQWDKPIVESFGTGKFLVRKGIPLNGPVSRLDPAMISFE